MTLKVFNTLTRKKEEFKPIKKNEVTMYTCGPTVYAPPHIGNYRSFLMGDVIRRYLEFKGFKVKYLMNITDIDDKTIRDSVKEGLTLKEFTQKYEKHFFSGLKLLNIKKAYKYPRATEHVKDMMKMVKALVEKGYAYVKMGSVYYDISKFKDYGKLSHLDLDHIKIGATVEADEYEKDNPQDFALMKRSTTEELKHGIFFKMEWGNVRPGWHIECSALSMKYLGKTIDIHTGGIDLVFPHHENEIAQSEAYTGKKFVNYWMHGEFLLVEGQKMAKSLGNFLTLSDLTDKGYDPRAIRYLLMSSHYRQQLNFTFKGLEAAKNTVDGLFDFVRKLKEPDGKSNPAVKSLIKEAGKKFEEAMDDDIGINVAVASVFEFMNKINKLVAENSMSKENARDVTRLMLKFDKVLGLNLIDATKEEKISKEIEDLIKKREDARKKGDWKTADEIRNKIRELGYVIEDTDSGVKWKKV